MVRLEFGLNDIHSHDVTLPTMHMHNKCIWLSGAGVVKKFKPRPLAVCCLELLQLQSSADRTILSR